MRCTYRLIMLVVLSLCSLTACSAPLQGPEADLHAIATPDPVSDVVRRVSPPAPPSVPGPTPAQGQFRAWVPREVAPNGDITEGHWVTVSATPPAVEVVEPAQPMPRAPKTVFGVKPTPLAPPQPPVLAPTTVPQATSQPMLPSSFFSQHGQTPLRSQWPVVPQPGWGGQ